MPYDRFSLFTNLNSSQEDMEVEIEHEWLIELTNPEDQLKDLGSELQDQIELRENDYVIRTRRINNNPDKATFTIKQKNGESSVESSSDVNLDIHHTLIDMDSARFTKVRYFLPMTINHNGTNVTLHWELDRYYLPDGTFDPICKLDLEHPGEIEMPAIPFKHDYITQLNVKGWSDKKKKFVDDFFDRVKL